MPVVSHVKPNAGIPESGKVSRIIRTSHEICQEVQLNKEIQLPSAKNVDSAMAVELFQADLLQLSVSLGAANCSKDMLSLLSECIPRTCALDFSCRKDHEGHVPDLTPKCWEKPAVWSIFCLGRHE